MVLNWPERSLQLHDLEARAMHSSLVTFPWRVSPAPHHLDRGQLAQVSINAIDQELSLNNFNSPAHRLLTGRRAASPAAIWRAPWATWAAACSSLRPSRASSPSPPAAGCRAAGQGMKGVQRRAGPRHPAAEAHPEGIWP